MSVLDDFVRIRLYRERASEFELLVEAEASPDVRRRFRVIARHYRELMDRELRADNARMADLIERARLQRQQAVPKASLPATSQGAVEIVKSPPLAAEHETARRESVPVEAA
jgi:hypothetical protein